MEYPIRKCVTCGKFFRPKTKNHKYCLWKTCAPKQGNRALIFRRDNYQCFYCGLSSYEDRVRLALDHLIPVVEKGKPIAANLVTACYSCNATKSGKKTSERILAKMIKEIKKRNRDAHIAPHTKIGPSRRSPHT